MKKTIKKLLVCGICSAVVCGISCAAFADSKNIDYSAAVSSSMPASPIAESPAEFKFKPADSSISGQEYVLLDVYDSDAEKKEYFVLAEYGVPKGIGALDSGKGIDFYNYADTEKKPWGWSADAEDEHNWWNPSAEGSTANFINSDEVVSAVIDENVGEYVTEHEWHFENAKGFTPASVTTKYALLSGREYIEYSDRIGYSVHNVGQTSLAANGFWYLRTPNAAAENAVAAVRVHTAGQLGKIVFLSNTQALGYLSGHTRVMRPCFYLSEDFFRNVKLDIDSLGAEVKKVIRDTIPYEDISDLYTTEELLQIGYDVPDPDALCKIVSQGFNEDKTLYSIEFSKSSAHSGKLMLIVTGFKNAEKDFGGTVKTVPQLIYTKYKAIEINGEDSGRLRYELPIDFEEKCDDTEVYLWFYPSLKKVEAEDFGRILPEK